LGHPALAVAVARRGYDAAERLGDPALTASTAVTRTGNLTRLNARHRAAELAKATGECNDLNYHFGPANVAAWSVSIGVELQRGPEAADRIAPTRTRNDPLARELVLTLDRRARRRVWELDSLRNRFGIGDARSSRDAKP
jgi:hypothetical protein